VSVLSSDFTRIWSSNATQMLFENVEASFKGESGQSRRLVHEAATIAGMALANAFVGIAHSLAHQLGGHFHIPHGVACAIALPHVIRFNSNIAAKQAYFPQHKTVQTTLIRYGELLDLIAPSNGVKTLDGKVELLVFRFEQLCKSVEIPLRVRDATSDSEEKYLKLVPTMALSAFDDQCTCSNPRYPLVAELERLLRAMY
jgi:acetaldehyde dehydrogenase/alcohol dehydrogenase